MRRVVVKTYLTKSEVEILDELCQRLGGERSDRLRIAFLEYAKSLNLLNEKLHGVNFERIQKPLPIGKHYPAR